MGHPGPGLVVVPGWVLRLSARKAHAHNHLDPGLDPVPVGFHLVGSKGDAALARLYFAES